MTCFESVSSLKKSVQLKQAFMMSWSPLVWVNKKFTAFMSLLDPLSDFLVFYSLMKRGHHWWASFCVIFNLLPILVIWGLFRSNEKRLAAFQASFDSGANLVSVSRVFASNTARQLVGFDISPEAQAYLKVRLIAHGVFANFPWTLFQVYILVRQHFLRITVVNPYTLPVSFASSLFSVYVSYTYFSSFSRLSHEGNKRQFLEDLLELGREMAPPAVLERLLKERHVTINNNMAKMHMKGLKVIGKAIRQSQVLQSVKFEDTHIDEIDGIPQDTINTWQLFCLDLCKNFFHLRYVAFTPLPGMLRYQGQFLVQAPLYLEQVKVGDQVQYERQAYPAVDANNFKMAFAAWSASVGGQLPREKLLEAMQAARQDSWRALAGMLAARPDLIDQCTDLIHCACEDGAKACLQLLLHCGADYAAPGGELLHEITRQPRGKLPLMCAAMEGNTSIMKFLFEAKADPNGVDSNGGTCLMLCSASDANAEAMKELLDHGANPNTLRVDGAHALHVAAFEGAPKIISILAAGGAEMNQVMADLGTPVMTAALLGRDQALKQLIKDKGDPQKTDDQGRTALSIAQANNHQPCVDILSKY